MRSAGQLFVEAREGHGGNAGKVALLIVGCIDCRLMGGGHGVGWRCVAEEV